MLFNAKPTRMMHYFMRIAVENSDASRFNLDIRMCKLCRRYDSDRQSLFKRAQLSATIGDKPQSCFSLNDSRLSPVVNFYDDELLAFDHRFFVFASSFGNATTSADAGTGFFGDGVDVFHYGAGRQRVL